ncbi:P-loop containing nucleoside triphosphate hydrolase protein [Suillus discolor]|uniref:P-loop containing nucleoside triphosphate hydrolase protein n=1 Tax=Suillus discolor TaxID=1912936 RepID=A0A9P7F7H6_9AGAM|nr:P-loop containing nucleoside triphosphate hydrolase protein [Suillus discolor]KAG2108067.1 P-loop containing nucleoside triphosphate hydrolase protein [Suillus discolor]
MLDLFSKDRIVNEAGLRAALRHLDARSSSGATALQATVEHMLSSPHIFAYIISVWDRREAMISQIMTDFPTKSQEYPASIARKMLDNLSMNFLACPAESLAMDVSRDITHHRCFSEGALPVLFALNSMEFSGARSFEDEIFDKSNDRFVKKKVRNRNRPKAHTSIDRSLFVRLGVVVPLTSEAAALLSTQILAKLKNALSFYFSLLRRTELAGDIKALLFPIVGEYAKYVAPEVSSTDVESPTDRLNVYQLVQHMKTALYFDNADGFGEWRILISTQAYKHLREFRRADKNIFKIIFKKIKQLSNGHFSDDNHKRLNGPDAGIPIYDAKMTKDLRLVYQIDCVPDKDGKSERQVIKIYGIYMDAQLDRVWDALGSHLARKGREYRRRCIFRKRPLLSKYSAILPGSFPLADPEPECPGSPLNLSDKDNDHLHSLLVLEKYVTFSQAFLHSLIADQDVQHVFMLTPQEQKIVECTTSCYVLGRRGTGKTTTMLFKILGIQRAWEMSAIDMLKPRQIFVTKSRVLATRVEEYFTKLLESLALAGYTLEELAKMKARSVQEGPVDLNDLPESQMNMPMKYSELEDKHFPLFLTFDRLAKMIAADIFSKKDSAGVFFNADAHDCFVTYDVFTNQYWPYFPQNLSQNLNPWLVFSEFMGIIKGSEHTLTCPEGVLDRQTYLLLPHRSNPNFANQRGILYDMFEHYTKMKRQRRHHDVADRTHAILKVLRSQRFPGQQIDYLYVDEAQDNLLIDALFLRQLCKNPDGLFWAGEISAESSFRFSDLKAFLYRVEQQNISVNSAGACPRQPAMFQLAINYRSHGGIINCASSVVELITKFWPNTIDNLRPEKEVVDGPKPVFFTDWDKDTVHHQQFWLQMRDKAELCILVRDNAARQKFRDQVGQIGLIMTLYESKGMEFDDVLLYNFFEDSAIDLSRWHIVLNGVDGRGYAPNFERDEARYAGVCSELKLLYVGITRAKKNVWIVDKSDRSEPMRKFWTSRNQIENCTLRTCVPHPVSTPEEWAYFGHSLFSYKRYPQAIHCFERANLHRKAKVCEAYQLREVARSSVGVASLSDQKRAFNVAADAFSDCAATATGIEKLQYYRNSADCYVRAGDDLKATKAYLKFHRSRATCPCGIDGGLIHHFTIDYYSPYPSLYRPGYVLDVLPRTICSSSVPGISVFHDNLITRLKALSQIQLDFEKRAKDAEGKFTEKFAEMRRQLDVR